MAAVCSPGAPHASLPEAGTPRHAQGLQLHAEAALHADAWSPRPALPQSGLPGPPRTLAFSRRARTHKPRGVCATSPHTVLHAIMHMPIDRTLICCCPRGADRRAAFRVASLQVCDRHAFVCVGCGAPDQRRRNSAVVCPHGGAALVCCCTVRGSRISLVPRVVAAAAHGAGIAHRGLAHRPSAPCGRPIDPMRPPHTRGARL